MFNIVEKKIPPLFTKIVKLYLPVKEQLAFSFLMDFRGIFS